jgi:hypothetical protein
MIVSVVFLGLMEQSVSSSWLSRLIASDPNGRWLAMV